jgi:hypothetical protein
MPGEGGSRAHPHVYNAESSFTIIAGVPACTSVDRTKYYVFLVLPRLLLFAITVVPACDVVFPPRKSRFCFRCFRRNSPGVSLSSEEINLSWTMSYVDTSIPIRQLFGPSQSASAPDSSASGFGKHIGQICRNGEHGGLYRLEGGARG